MINLIQSKMGIQPFLLSARIAISAFSNTVSPLNSSLSIILTIEQTCRSLSISQASLRRYETSIKDFPKRIKLGRRRVGYLREDVEAYIRRQREAAMGKELASDCDFHE